MPPVFHQGRPLMRNGHPAMSAKCCCVPGCGIFACGDCYFPTTKMSPAQYDAALIAGGGRVFQDGGPSQITDFEVTTLVHAPFAAYPWDVYTFEIRQSGASKHRVTENYCDIWASPIPGRLPFRAASVCEWIVPCRLQQILHDGTIYNDEYVEAVVVHQRTSTGGGPLVSRWQSVGATPTRFATDDGKCAGHVEAIPQFLDFGGGWTFETTGSFNAVGGKPWPPGFSVNSTGQLIYKGRIATTKDLPEGFL